MPEFWIDSDSLIESKKGPYAFDIAPGFWKFLEQKISEETIASSVTVYNELEDYGAEDDLLQWAKQQKDAGFFITPDPLVQTLFRQIADYVNNTYPQHQASKFLDDADPWIIAHAKAYGGRVVTFEKSAPNSQKPKIPDICHHFEMEECLNLYEMVRKLGMSL